MAFEHPAIMPEQLAADMITTWTNPGDTVFDPFTGAGTTAKMCHVLGRKFNGTEISLEYCDIINRRLDATINPVPVEEKTKGGFYLPSSAQDNFKTYYAVVLSIGRGVENKRTGEFVTPEVKQGDVVLYDKSVPWGVEAMNSEGQKYPVKISNMFDLSAQVI
jgi:co-chaperonin GroES (HSP10)